MAGARRLAYLGRRTRGRSGGGKVLGAYAAFNGTDRCFHPSCLVAGLLMYLLQVLAWTCSIFRSKQPTCVLHVSLVLHFRSAHIRSRTSLSTRSSRQHSYPSGHHHLACLMGNGLARAQYYPDTCHPGRIVSPCAPVYRPVLIAFSRCDRIMLRTAPYHTSN